MFFCVAIYNILEPKWQILRLMAFLNFSVRNSFVNGSNKTFICNFSNILFNQKTPVHPVLVAAGGDIQLEKTEIATLRLNRPRGPFSEEEGKNPAYCRHWISPPMLILDTIL